jgi:hypothetical protein
MSIETARKACIRSDCHLRRDCRVHLFNAPPDVDTRVWMAEKVGHECHHFLAVPAVVADHLDGGLD